MQEPIAHVEKIVVQDTDGDYRSAMKPSALLRYAQQVASDHSRAYGMGDQYYKDRNLAFLIGKQALRFDRVPTRSEELTFTSLPEKSSRGTNKRLTLVTDAEGKEVARVDSRWILVDTTDEHILRLPPEEIDCHWNEQVPGELPQQVHKTRELTRAGVWKASYSLCDINGHINNAFYLDIACDALPLEVMQQGPVRFACIKYHREMLLGQEVEVFYGPSANGWYVVGKRDGQTAFELYYEF